MYIFMKHKYFQKHTRPMNYFLSFAVDEMLEYEPQKFVK